MERANLTILAALSLAVSPSIAQSALPEPQAPAVTSIPAAQTEQAQQTQQTVPPATILSQAAAQAERQLQQTFANLKFEDFAPSPVKGPIYQASAGGRLLYFAPESEHLIFAAVYDRHGSNLTALGESAAARRKLARIDLTQALTIGPAGAPEVVEFTDPDCPYCRSLDRFWAAKAAEGKPVRRRVFFVSGIHPEAAAKAEHILCSADPEAEFKAIYAGGGPAKFATCAEGRRKVEADTALVAEMGIGGTPTVIADGQIISGFRQGEIEAFLDAARAQATLAATSSATATSTPPPPSTPTPRDPAGAR